MIHRINRLRTMAFMEGFNFAAERYRDDIRKLVAAIETRNDLLQEARNEIEAASGDIRELVAAIEICNDLLQEAYNEIEAAGERVTVLEQPLPGGPGGAGGDAA